MTALIVSGMVAFTIAEPAQTDVIQADECFTVPLMLRVSGEECVQQEGSIADRATYTKEVNGEQIPFIETSGQFPCPIQASTPTP